MKNYRVFQFSYEVDYGGGIMLVAAENPEQAEELVKEEPRGFGYWVFDYEIGGLTMKAKKPVIITSFTRCE